jgi:hypothetical protein
VHQRIAFRLLSAGVIIVERLAGASDLIFRRHLTWALFALKEQWLENTVEPSG